jgi:hypothetical protein
MRDFILPVAIGLFLQIGICQGVDPPLDEPFDAPWVASGRQLRLRVWPDKPIYKSGEKITMTFSLTNVAGSPKSLQRGCAFMQYVIQVSRDGKVIEYDKRRLIDRFTGWSFSSSLPIPVGKSHRETLNMDNALDVSIPGRYVVSVRKWFSPKVSLPKRPTNPRKGIDYLDATTTFNVLPQEPAEAPM